MFYHAADDPATEMILRDKVHIGCAPGAVWPLIGDPLLMKTWNHRIREIVPVSLGERQDGFRYRIRYQINGRESNFEAEIMEYQEARRFVLHMSGGYLPKNGYIQEIYELSGSETATLLRQEIDVYNAGIGFFRGGVLGLFHRLAGKKYLPGLKSLAEGRKT